MFTQKAVVAWDNAPSNRIMVSLRLPGPMRMDQWPKDVRASINMWPLQKTAHVVTNQMATEVFRRGERRRLQARHIGKKIEPDWPMIRDQVWTKQATFFLSGCCMAQRRSLSGRSPFCQRKLSDSRKINGNFVP